MIELDSVRNRFFKCRFVQTRKSYANMQLFIILNINFVGKYRVPRMRFERFCFASQRWFFLHLKQSIALQLYY